MKISIKDLLEIDNIESYDVKFNRTDPIFTAVFIMDGKNSSSMDANTVTKENMAKLQTKGSGIISILTDKKFRENLKNINPSQLQPVSGKMFINDLLNLAKEYEIMNLKSQKQRYITVLEDICYSESNELFGGQQLLIEYGTKLTLKMINKIEKKVNPVEEIEYRDSEEGVLVFIPDVKDFKLKVDLFAILTSLDIEIYDAKDLKEAVKLYKIKFPKLVILGKLNQNIYSKILILELEKFDPFVKKLNYDESPASKRKFETNRIKNNYYSGYSELLKLANMKKGIFPEEIKKDILAAFKRLQANYSFKNYIETAFTIKQFGRMFNITTLWSMLENIKNEKSSM